MTERDVTTESQSLITQAEALIEEVEKNRGEIEKLYDRHGLSREDLDKIIEKGMAALTPEQKAEIERDEIEWRRGIEEILRSPDAPQAPRVHPGMVRI